MAIWLLYGLLLISAIAAKHELVVGVEELDFESSDVGHHQEKIISLQQTIEKQALELDHLRSIILSSDCFHSDQRVKNAFTSSLSSIPHSPDEIPLVWAVEESEVDGLAASINSVLQSTLPVKGLTCQHFAFHQLTHSQ
jgi:hypothetical protein